MVLQIVMQSCPRLMRKSCTKWGYLYRPSSGKYRSLLMPVWMVKSFEMTIKAFRQNFNKAWRPCTQLWKLILFFSIDGTCAQHRSCGNLLNINTELNQDVENDVVQFMNRLEKRTNTIYNWTNKFCGKTNSSQSPCFDSKT